MPSMFPLLAVALLVWAGLFTFLFVVDRKVTALEHKLDALNTHRTGREV